VRDLVRTAVSTVLICVVLIPGERPARAGPRGPSAVPAKPGSAGLVPRRKRAGLATSAGPLTEIALARITVTGGLDEAIARAMVEGLQPALESCLVHHAAPREGIDVELRVTAAGRTEAKVRGSRTAAQPFAECVRSAFAAARFPARPLPSQIVLRFVLKARARRPAATKGAGGVDNVLGAAPAGQGNTRGVAPPGRAEVVDGIAVRAAAGGGLDALARGLEKETPLDVAVVRATMVQHAPALRRCCAYRRTGQPLAPGALDLEVRVDAGGTVSGARVRAATAADQPLQRCVAAAARAWRFPAPRGGAATVSFTVRCGREG